MLRTAFHRLASDVRFQVTLALLVIAASVVALVITGSPGTIGLVLSVIAIVAGGAKAWHQQSSPSR